MAKKMISLEISDELREALRVEAFKQSSSISAVMRQILEEKLLKTSNKEYANE
jgi:plasmid stability protein